MNRLKFFIAVGTTLGLLASQPGHAVDSGVILTPMLGYYNHDSDVSLDDHIIGGAAIGYKTTTPFAVELNYFTGSTETPRTDQDFDIDQIYLTGLYYFNQENRVQPYALLGGGQQVGTAGMGDYIDSIGVLGAGVNVVLNQHLRLRPDIRLIHNLDEDLTGVAAVLGIQWLFGQSSEPTKPAPKAKPEIQDSDADGVIDSQDLCANTEVDQAVDMNGCPVVVDSDKDGVADADDQCLDTIEGAKVNEVGCYIVLTETKQVEMQVAFENNSFVIAPSSYHEIEKVVTFMRQYPLTEVILEGHTDDLGSASYNQKLSLQRAQAVAALMANNYGIEASRIEAVGFGESKPLYPNNTAENRAKNRRVTAKVSALIETIQQ